MMGELSLLGGVSWIDEPISVRRHIWFCRFIGVRRAIFAQLGLTLKLLLADSQNLFRKIKFQTRPGRLAEQKIISTQENCVIDDSSFSLNFIYYCVAIFDRPPLSEM